MFFLSLVQFFCSECEQLFSLVLECTYFFFKETSTGERKILDLVDTTGSGDVDTSTVVKIEEKTEDNGRKEIKGKSGRLLTIPGDWENPSGEWHIGIKAAFELFPGNLRSRLQVSNTSCLC